MSSYIFWLNILYKTSTLVTEKVRNFCILKLIRTIDRFFSYNLGRSTNTPNVHCDVFSKGDMPQWAERHSVLCLTHGGPKLVISSLILLFTMIIILFNILKLIMCMYVCLCMGMCT